MSHVVQIQTQVRDATAVRAGCKRLGLDVPVEGETKLFSQTVTGLAVQLREWRYPVVFDLATGESKYDNYGGRWGKQERLDEFMQAYAIERTKLEARRKGYSVIEQPLVDGSVKLTLSMGAES
jgi:hypothetical protein